MCRAGRFKKGMQHMKKHLLPVLLMLCLFFSMAVCACASSADPPFTDAATNTWYADAVAYCQENGLMNGVTQTTFAPDTLASRAMLITALYHHAGSPEAASASHFTDIAGEAGTINAVNWAVTEGIVSGYADGRFGGNDPITREQLVAILWRSEGRPSSGTSEAFADQEQIAPYAQEAVAWARNKGIVSGMENHRFMPGGYVTRAQMAVMLYQWLNQAPSAGTFAENQGEEGMPALIIKIGDETFHAALLDNPATGALLEQLPFTIMMEELNGNEKYYYLPKGLPVDALQPEHIQEGDLMLYGSDCLVLFYKDFATSYSYTPLGSVEDPAGLAAALGNGSVEVCFQIDKSNP